MSGQPLRNKAELAARVRAGGTVWMAGAYDALSALLIDQSPFDAVFTTGFGVSASLLGAPDVEVYTMTENLGVVRNVCAAVKKPVIADTDTGYGNVINVQRTVREFERAGVAGMIFEDQVVPKRCPAAAANVSVISTADAVAKIRAAVDARRDADTLIIARTDALDAEDAIDRACRFAEAGADVIQPISRTFKGFDDLKRLRDACGRRLSLQLMEGNWIGALSAAQVEEVAALATYPLVPLMSATRAVQENLAALWETRGFALPHPQRGMADFKKIVGFEAIEALQAHYELAPLGEVLARGR